METFKRILKKIFCLPPLGTVLTAAFGYGFVLAVAVFDIQNPVLRYASYSASAYALIVTISASVESSPPEIPITADFAPICSRRFFRPFA